MHDSGWETKVSIRMGTPSFNASTRTPRPLAELEGEWLALFTDMQRNPSKYYGIDPGRLAAPFLSTAVNGA